MQDFTYDFVEELPDNIAHKQMVEELKEQSTAFSVRLRNAGLEDLAQRVESCADKIKFQQMKNGYLRFVGGFFCRVRGCPMCEWRKSRKVGATASYSLNRIFKENPKMRVVEFIFSLPSCTPQNLRRTLREGQGGWQRMQALRIWKSQIYCRFLQVKWNKYTVDSSIRVLAFFVPAKLNGKNHISLEVLEKAWNQSCRRDGLTVKRVNWKQEDATISKLSGLTGISSIVCFRDCPDEYLEDAIEQVDKLKWVTGTPPFNFTQKKPEKKRYPSEIANLKAIRSKSFFYTPNPYDDDHANQYLSSEGLVPLGEEIVQLPPEVNQAIAQYKESVKADPSAAEALAEELYYQVLVGLDEDAFSVAEQKLGIVF